MTELLQLHIIRLINTSFLVHYQKCSYAGLSAAVSTFCLSSIWNHVYEDHFHAKNRKGEGI